METHKISSKQTNSDKKPAIMATVTTIVPSREDQEKRYYYLAIVKTVVCLSVLLLLVRYGHNDHLVKGNAKYSNDKTILLWNDQAHSGGWSYRQCGCIVTTNHDSANVDAIVFNGDRPYSFKGIEMIKRSPNFLAVFAMRVPQSQAPNPLLVHGESVFNFTMSYRKDSDLMWADYYLSEELNKQESFLKQLNLSTSHIHTKLRSKSSLVFYMVYEITDQSLPESLYLQELRKHMELDALITCRGYYHCGHYKFMLVFETSSCPDFVNPQFYMALSNFVVPVVVGGGNISHLVPPGSYVNGADFPNPELLAKHLMKLSTQPELYEQFFLWHSKYQLHKNRQPFCGLCRQLGKLPRRKRQPDEFLKWWTGYQCPNRTTNRLD